MTSQTKVSSDKNACHKSHISIYIAADVICGLIFPVQTKIKERGRNCQRWAGIVGDTEDCSVLQCDAVCCSVLQCVAECCSAVQCCSVLLCVAVRCIK